MSWIHVKLRKKQQEKPEMRLKKPIVVQRRLKKLPVKQDVKQESEGGREEPAAFFLSTENYLEDENETGINPQTKAKRLTEEITNSITLKF